MGSTDADLVFVHNRSLSVVRALVKLSRHTNTFIHNLSWIDWKQNVLTRDWLKSWNLLFVHAIKTCLLYCYKSVSGVAFWWSMVSTYLAVLCLTKSWLISLQRRVRGKRGKFSCGWLKFRRRWYLLSVSLHKIIK